MKLEAGTKGFLLDGIPYVKGKYEPLVRGSNVGVCYREEGKAYELVYPIPFEDWVDENDAPYVSVQTLLDSMETLFFLAANGGGGVTSITGGLIDNTDPSNPTSNLANGSGTTANGNAVNLGGTLTQNTEVDGSSGNYTHTFRTKDSTISLLIGTEEGAESNMILSNVEGQATIRTPLAYFDGNYPFGNVNTEVSQSAPYSDPYIRYGALKGLTQGSHTNKISYDFENGIVGTPFSSFTSGVGSSVLPIQILTVGESGMVSLSTGTTSTGRAAIATNIDSICADGGVIVYNTRVYIPVLSTAIEEYILRVGGGDVVIGDFVDGIYVEYDRSVSVNWRGCTANNGSRTKTSANPAPVVVGWNKISMEVSVNGFNATIKVNDITIANNIVNIPKTPARSFGLMFSLIKTVGTTNRSVYIDHVDFLKEFTIPRI